MQTLKVLIICSIILCNAFMNNIILPFLSFMVSEYNIPLKDVGRYSGYLMSSYMFGQILSSYLWGYLSDRIGRRPTLLFGLAMTGITFLLFGYLNHHFYLAIVFRMLNGSANGVAGIAKTVLSEVTTQNTQAKAFAWLGVSRALGMILGPLVGGLLCLPAKKYPSFFPAGSLFDRYPYALPCTIGSVAVFIVIIIAWLVLEETHPSLQETTPLIAKQEKVSISELLCDTRILRTMIVWTLANSLYIQYDELFTLWSRMPLEDQGLDFDSSDQGIAFTVGGIALFMYQALLFSKVEKYLGLTQTFKSGMLVALPALIFLPLAWVFRKGETIEVMAWVFVFLGIIFKTVGSLQAFTSITIMVSNSCVSSVRGSVNGIGQTLGALGRMIGPIVAGTMFSFSLNNIPWRFHGIEVGVYFTFCYLFFFTIFIYMTTSILPASIDYRLPEDEE